MVRGSESLLSSPPSFFFFSRCVLLALLCVCVCCSFFLLLLFLPDLRCCVGGACGVACQGESRVSKAKAELAAAEAKHEELTQALAEAQAARPTSNQRATDLKRLQQLKSGRN